MSIDRITSHVAESVSGEFGYYATGEASSCFRPLAGRTVAAISGQLVEAF